MGHKKFCVENYYLDCENQLNKKTTLSIFFQFSSKVGAIFLSLCPKWTLCHSNYIKRVKFTRKLKHEPDSIGHISIPLFTEIVQELSG